jgi:acyl-coenzyme A synthetase/AMP-(fatty) acid ligase
MPEPVKAGRVPQVTQKLEEVVKAIHSSYECLSDLIEDSNRPVLFSPEGSPAVTHTALKKSIRGFRLPLQKDDDKNPVVAIAIPNGSLLAATCVSVTAHFAAAPINPSVGAEQFRADVEQVRAKCILTTPEVADRLGLGDGWVSERNIEVFYADFTSSQTLGITKQDGTPISAENQHFQPNKSSDICLMLFTSGTSGTKKIVPLTMHLVIFGAMLVIDSWGLSSSDICLNMMPLFHMYVNPGIEIYVPSTLELTRTIVAAFYETYLLRYYLEGQQSAAQLLTPASSGPWLRSYLRRGTTRHPPCTLLSFHLRPTITTADSD